MHPNIKAFLDMVGMSELGPALLTMSNNGYNVIVGSTAKNPTLFTSYGDHPRQFVDMIINGKQVKSSAAGRYQILARFYDAYKASLKLLDFSPASQDAIAIQMIGECHAIDLITTGRFAEAVDACRTRWASLPGAGYNQNEHKLSFLQDAYLAAGGVVC